MSPQTIRIVAIPPGEAPIEVRKAWVGLELPLARGETGARRMPIGGVLTGPKTAIGQLFKLLTFGYDRARGYLVEAVVAIEILAEHAPDAAQWWSENSPHLIRPGRHLIFHAEVCEELF